MSKYAVGDVLRVRDWDDMEKEFGLTCAGNIDCEFRFIQSMKYMCGQRFTVERIENRGAGDIYRSEERIECDAHPKYNISEDMLEPFEEIPDFNTATEDELNSFLFS